MGHKGFATIEQINALGMTVVEYPFMPITTMWTPAQFGDRPELSRQDERKALQPQHKMRRWDIAYQNSCRVAGAALGTIYLPCPIPGHEGGLFDAWRGDADHVLPRHNFGKSTPENLALSCAACNRIHKGNRLPDNSYRAEIARVAPLAVAHKQSQAFVDFRNGGERMVALGGLSPRRDGKSWD